MIELQVPKKDKLNRSFVINSMGVIFALLFLLALKYLFPEYDASEHQVILFTASGAFLYNTIKESIK
jgi:hypothetical protein